MGFNHTSQSWGVNLFFIHMEVVDSPNIVPKGAVPKSHHNVDHSSFLHHLNYAAAKGSLGALKVL